MNILFLSSVNLTTNPRIYKELLLANAEGHSVTFIGFRLGNWSDKGDEQICRELPGIKFIYLDATRSKYVPWLYYSLLHLFQRAVWPFDRRSLTLSANGHSKRTVPMLRQLEKLEGSNFDLVAGHTLAALFPAASYAYENKCSYAFDVEDYHPGEWINTDVKNEKKRREYLLKRLLPSASYVTAASPLIAGNIEALVPTVKVTTVLNYFPVSEFREPLANTGNKMKLIWFSQNINAGRGLELIISVWESLRDRFELTLIGKLDDEFYKGNLSRFNEITIKSPMEQKELHRELAKYDIGLAIDISSNDYNRELAITNKILAYYQAGLYILATKTRAQDRFIKLNPLHGITGEQNSVDLLNSLQKIYASKEKIRAACSDRYKAASLSSWEKESEIIKAEWKKISA